MTDTPDTPDTTTDEPAVLPSILDDLRRSRSKIGEGAEPLDLPIPGYDGKLVIRFKWVHPSELAATAKQLQKIKEPTEQAIAAAADTLVATCQEVLVNVEDGLQPLSTNGEPITFADSKRLAYALNFESAKTARETCCLTFNNEYALIDAATRIVTWLEDTSKKVDEEFLGES